jgi:serine/threonine-protein kinase RsbW
MNTVVFPGRYESLSEIRDFVVEIAKEAGFQDFDLYAVELAVDEACSNIIEHAYGGENKGNIELTCNLTERGLEIVLRDHGKTFNPAIIPEPNFGLDIDELKPGGAGLFLMRKMMDEVTFDFSNDSGNVLTMIKYRKDGVQN